MAPERIAIVANTQGTQIQIDSYGPYNTGTATRGQPGALFGCHSQVKGVWLRPLTYGKDINVPQTVFYPGLSNVQNMKPDVTVREMMDREYVGVSESDDLLGCVELLLREDAEAAIVHHGSEHVGVVSERDILALLVEGPDLEEATAGDAMRESVTTISPDASLESAADTMSTRSAGRLLVTDGNEPLGMLTERDLIATRRHELNIIETGASEAEAVTAGMHESGQAPEGGFEEQGICEVCGALVHDLASFNGQLLCGDCRDM